MYGGVVMCKVNLFVKINTLVGLLFFGNMSLGMKRERENDGSSTVVKRAPLNAKEYLNESFKSCALSLKVEVLQREQISKANIDQVSVNAKNINEVSADGKLSILSLIVKPQRKNIDLVQANRKKILCSLPENITKKIISDELKKIDQQIFRNEVDAMRKFMDAYGIASDSQDYDNLMQVISRENDFNEISMRQPRKDTCWNCNVPVNVALAFEKVIKQNGFEPTSFNIDITNDKNFESCTSAAFKPPLPRIALVKNVSSDKKLYTYMNGRPGCFYVNKKLADATSEELECMATHEITHALIGHGLTRKKLIDFITHKNDKISYQEIVLSYEYAQLLLEQETSADTMLALQNPKFARASLKARGLYPNSYGILKTIDTNFDVLGYFSQKEFNTMVKSDTKD